MDARGDSVTADVSVVMAALCGWHERHAEAAAAASRVHALPHAVLLETYSLLTALPAAMAATATAAAASGLLDRHFPGEALPDVDPIEAMAATAATEVAGSATRDGLVALAARAAGQELLSVDRRAARTYARLDTAFRRL